MRSIQFIFIALLSLFSTAVESRDDGLIKKLFPIVKKTVAKSDAPSAAPIATKAPTAPKAKKDKKAGGDAIASSPPSILLSDVPSILISDFPSVAPSDAFSDSPSDLASDAPSV
jgi:hypothetical protein